MKMLPNDERLSLRDRISQNFSSFTHQHPIKRGRRVPKDLKQLVLRGHDAGIKKSEIRDLTGISVNTIVRWIANESLTPLARKLEVVQLPPVLPPPPKPDNSVIIRLVSGVTVEFSGITNIGNDFLNSLNSLEVANVTSC